MSKISFTKTANSYAEQLQKLKDRGLKIDSDKKVLHLLQKLSYFRLSGYWYPLLKEPKSLHQFKEGANFQTAFELYRFDRDLRSFVLKEIEKIEIAVRAQLIYEFSHNRNAFWLSDASNFKDAYKHGKTLDKLIYEFNRSDEEYLKAFIDKYTDPLPPCWMILEITSLGALSNIYANLKSLRPKRNVADAFGLDETTFASWLHCFTYIRNLCAHHSRLWNREIQVRPTIPPNPRLTWLRNTEFTNDKTYCVLSMMLYLLQSIDVKHQFIFRLRVLLSKYPCVDLSAMGFPKNWQKEPLWKFSPNLKQWVRLNIFSKHRL